MDAHPTQRAPTASDIDRLLAFVARPLTTMTLANVQASLTGKPSAQARTLAAVKSLLTFGQRTGYLPLNVGAAVELPSRKDSLVERILTEADIVRILALEPDRRNQILLRLLYIAGLRVSEIAALTWRVLQPRTDGGQVTVFGKGSKAKTVLLPNVIWRELLRFRQGTGVDGKVSRHWLRHSHATHALERGAPIHLVQATLGHASVAATGRYLHARLSDRSARYLAI